MEFFLLNVSAATDLCLIICIRRRARGGDVRARLLFLRPRGGNAEADMQSAIRGLLEKDLVTNDLGTFSPYDLFFALWMRQQM